MQSKKNWFLRKKDGSEYGPVSLNDLLRWSAQCRIVAGNAVSIDREEWTPVEDIPELEMHWMAHRADGKEYGPFALAAVQELFSHNVLPADAILVNRATGENKPLSEVIDLPGGEDEAEEAENVDDVNTVNQVNNQAAEHEAAAETAGSEAAAEDALAAKDGALERAETVNLVDRVDQDAPGEKVNLVDQDDPGDKTDAADEADSNDRQDTAPLLAQIEALQQELTSRHSEAVEASEAYQTKIATLEKKLQTARQDADAAAARLEALETAQQQSQQQAGDELADLRKQTAFMKKNIAVLHAELDEARHSAERRGKIMVGFGVLLTVVAALLISRSISGCRHRVEPLPTATDLPADTQQTDSATDSGRNGDIGSGTPTDIAWPSLRIDGLRTEAKADHLVIRFNEGAFSSLTNLSTAAVGQIKALVGQLRPSLANYRLVVEGHTDNIPMRPTGTFANNAALAAARAKTAVDLLKIEGANAIAAVSPGAAPYPNDTPENRRRNRTVVIRLYQ